MLPARAALASFLVCGLLGIGVAAEPGVPVRGEEVIAHLERTITWYQHVTSIEQLADESSSLLLRDRTHQSALRALQLAFDFALAEAALLRAARQPVADGAGTSLSSQSHNLDQVAAQAGQRVAGVQSRIADLDAALSKATARSRDTLEAQRRELEAELTLAKEIQNTVHGMVTFVGTAGSGSGAPGGLTAQINALEHSVPEARHDQQTAAPVPKAAAATAPAARPQFEGLVGLSIDLIAAERGRIQLNSLLGETDALLKGLDQLRNPFITVLRASIARSEAITNAASSENLQQLASGDREIDSLAAQFKQLSTVVVPLGEQAILIEASRGNLLEWRAALDRRYQEAGRYLLLRTGMMAIAIFVLLVLSEVGRRATFKYVREPRHRRQFLVLRRVLVGCAVTLVIILGFVTEFGSIATYIGFLTAGIAVALQNVILSVVGYFFLIGRYGVRVGDRVTIGGVTGNVIEIGLVRIYLMELIGGGADMHSTGRVVVFSNSVLFQPSALYKQMPGADYVWHTAKLTLARDSDFGEAERRLTDAVNVVYQGYKDQIEKQHAALERSVDIQISPPLPEGRLRFSEAGLEYLVRYPVVLKLATDTDDRVMKALYEEIAREPKLALAAGGQPAIVQGV